jgi:hypothetical protein
VAPTIFRPVATIRENDFGKSSVVRSTRRTAAVCRQKSAPHKTGCSVIRNVGCFGTLSLLRNTDDSPKSSSHMEG